MPIHLPPVDRRRFLSSTAGALAGGVGWLSLAVEGAESRDANPHQLALLSDTHIFQKRDTVHRRANMYEHLRQATAEILALKQAPVAVLINGDCAFSNGQAEDYAVLLELIGPYREAGLPLHLTLGNHDDRANFWQAIGADKPQENAVDNKHVSILKTERANWFLLDSLETTSATPGLLGEQQLEWLTTALDAHQDRPAIITVHHHPIAGHSMASGLKDTEALFAILCPRKQVKAYIFGHTHHWQQQERDGIHLVNLPPVAYPFNSIDPSGWVHVSLAEDGASFELRSIDPAHAKHGQRFDLKWRVA